MAKLIVGRNIIEDIQLVIFDKDGTIIELYHYWSRMVDLRARLICQRLGLGRECHLNLMDSMGVDLENKRLKPEGPVGLKKREIVMQAAIDYLASVGYPEMNELCFDVFREVDLISKQDLKEFIKPINGSYSLIAQLKNCFCKVAIATTDKTERAKLAMNFLGFVDMIDTIVGADLVSQSKPAPEMVNLILKLLKINSLNAAIVGDAITDVQMGINAGLKASVGVCTGLTSGDQLRKITPYVAQDVSEIQVIP